MDTIKCQAIVISAIDYKEKDKLVTLFSFEYGIITANLKSVKTASAKLKFAKELFCFGEFIIQKPSNVIVGVEVVDTFFDVTKKLEKFYNACAVVEIVKTILQPGEINGQLFLSTLKVLGNICYENTEDYALAKYLISIFDAFGYRLALDKCAECGQPFMSKRWLNLEYGEIVCNACKTINDIEISNRCHLAMKILNNTDYEKLKSLKLAKGSEKECLQVLVRNFKKRFNVELNLLQ
ncbi:MAG: DNA repair protein RecO [Clostridia bacterium]|nr:DNA repair protein RecO [Clostridia bacterium]